jgi:hypothetical protein
MSGGRPAATSGRRVDLHSHTHYSDGALTPQALLGHARARGVVILAVTDHDTVAGLPEALAGADDTLEVIPGIELSSTLDGQDLHILGYFIRPEDPALRARLERFREERRERARAMVERLAELGVPVDAEAVLASAGPGVVGRPHVAQALLLAGHVTGMDEAFQRFLGPRGQAFVPRPAFHSEEAVGTIRAAGGCAVLAHPGGSVSARTVEQLRDAGLAGVEVWHPMHGPAAQRRWFVEAERLGLVPSGGSDFHGPQRGTDLGAMPVPERTVERLRATLR